MNKVGRLIDNGFMTSSLVIANYMRDWENRTEHSSIERWFRVWKFRVIE